MAVVVLLTVAVKAWMGRLPSVEEARPGRCERCLCAARPVGESLGIWGHGVRERQVVGPLEPGEPTTRVVVTVRRYLCRRCGLVMTVLPRGVSAGRWYPLWVIVLALASWVAGHSSRAVRGLISPDASTSPSWPSLRRWSRAESLAPLTLGLPHSRAPRVRAAALVQAWAGFAPPPHGRVGVLEAAVAGARQVMARGSTDPPLRLPTL
jgi:hypothetical protein